jgi:hypothetical protein
VGELNPNFKEVCPSATQAPYPTHTPQKKQTQPNPTKVITINLQFFKKLMFFNLIIVFFYQRFFSFQVLLEV